MSLQVEKLEKNMAKLTIETSIEEFEAAIEKVYRKNKNKITMQGFRKGKAPRAMIEKVYGPSIFFEDAANDIIPNAYENAAKESGLDIVSNPSIDVVQIEHGKPFIFTAEVAVKPEVTLGEYKGIEIEKKEVEVTEEDINAELDKVRDQNSRIITIEDRAAQMDDIAVIDFEGFMDGVAFDGGKGEDYALTLGSHSFIGTFEEQLVGRTAGEEVKVEVSFPEDYHVKELAGKPAVFEVKVREIKKKELPELDDDFAQDVSEFDTLAEYKEDIKKSLSEKKQKEIESEKENEVIKKIIENSSMEIPDAMLETQIRQMMEEFAQRIQMQGLSLDQYLQYTGMDKKTFIKSIKPQAMNRIQTRLVMEAVAKAENFQATEEELEEELKKMASMYQMEIEKLKETITDSDKKHMQEDIAVQKAVDFVTEAAVEK